MRTPVSLALLTLLAALAAAVLWVGCGGVSPGHPGDAAVDRNDGNIAGDVPNVGDGAGVEDGLGDGPAADAGDVSEAPVAPPVVESFTATPALLPAAGGMVRLQWVVRGATTIGITGVGMVTGDSVMVVVASSQTFALTALNAGGFDTKFVNVAVDSTIPTITSFSPVPNATGVAADTNIIVTFSEPMNRGKTQAAYTSTDIPSALAAFTWNDAGTVLTINPADDLSYADGTSLDTKARTYNVAFADVAEDVAGNKLARTNLAFQTLRKLTLKMRRLSAFDGWVDDAGTVLSTDGTNIWIGDTAGNGSTRGFLTFDIGSLPATLATVDRAEAFAYQMTVVGTPYATLGGAITAEHVTYDALNAAAFSSAALRTAGAFSDNATTGWKKADVTSSVREDFARRESRGARSQFRLAFPAATNSNAAVDRVELYDSPDAFEPYLNIATTP